MSTQAGFRNGKEKRPAALLPTGRLSRVVEVEFYSLVATVENVEVRLVPTVPSTVTAATAIRAAIRPYSMAVAPSSFFKSLFKVANIRVLQRPLTRATCPDFVFKA